MLLKLYANNFQEREDRCLILGNRRLGFVGVQGRSLFGVEGNRRSGLWVMKDVIAWLDIVQS